MGRIRQMRDSSTYKVTMAALLIAVGIAIPIFMPVKFVMEPASYTLASHVAIFIAMFIDPAIAVAVAVGTTIGFLTSFPLVIALRAASHLVFVAIGGLYLKRYPETLSSPVRVHVFSFVIALIHAACEVAVVCAFYFGGNMPAYNSLRLVFLLIGVGSVIHSMVDFEISLGVYKALEPVMLKRARA